MEHLVFVYGTLKEGFRNFHINHGRRLPGEFVTVQRHALLLVGPTWLPWLLQDPRDDTAYAVDAADAADAAAAEGAAGHHVIGQVYAVDDAGLAAMDELEQLEDAGWYQRRRIEVLLHGGAGSAPLQTWVYFGSREGLLRDGRRLGPLQAFTAEHQDLLPREQWPTA